ncbi:MAG TPA: hemolysin family protein [Acidimicrobiales bacterium]|nr:hemolysin family protein [Acidimicrobiales bacterium]
MTPRVDVVALPAPVRLADVVAAVRRSGHSHFPVYQDDPDRLVGVLFLKDLFSIDLFGREAPSGNGSAPNEAGRAVPGSGAAAASAAAASGVGATRAGASGATPQGAAPQGAGSGAMTSGPAPATAAGSGGDLVVTRRVREPYVVPETRSALEVLAEMRRRRRGFAVVVDEYGGFAGVLTVNDLVSELVGDLRDEFDRSSSPAILRIDAVRYLVDGACAVSEVREQLGIDLPDGEYVTLGGFLFDAFGRIPEEGDVVTHDGWQLRITRMDRRRIAKVVMEAPSASMVPAGGESRPADGK